MRCGAETASVTGEDVIAMACQHRVDLLEGGAFFTETVQRNHDPLFSSVHQPISHGWLRAIMRDQRALKRTPGSANKICPISAE